MNMIVNDHYYSKDNWKRIVWEKVWRREEDDVSIMYKQPGRKHDMFDVIDQPYYLIWWIISDMFPKHMGMCEMMASMLCGCSRLKRHDLKLKKSTFWAKCCVNCDLGVVEDPWHIIMQCPHFEQGRGEMFDEIKGIGSDAVNTHLEEPSKAYGILMGKHNADVTMEHMVKLCIIAGTHICRMYVSATNRE